MWPTQAQTLSALQMELAEQTGWENKNDGFKKLASFLDGSWLEGYVLSVIQKLDVGIHDSAAGIELVRTEGASIQFEFDVAAIRGYQLFAFSCTTDTQKDLCKSKLFEVYTRARQMGGDEAKVALVSGYTETDKLLNEVMEDWLAPRRMIKIFGPKAWLNQEEFTNQLKDWFIQ